MPAALRVMVVDDHPMWRDAVERDLQDAGFDVVAVAADGHQAIARFRAARPQVVVLDLQIPGPGGVAVTADVLGHDPSARVLILSASGEQHDVLEAVKAGATGYLVKSASRQELLDAVRRVAEGDSVFTPGLAGLVLGEFRRMNEGGPEPEPENELTSRETEILKMVAKGMSYKQIAERLVLSHRTVQNHVQNTLRKLQMHNRVELTRYAIEQGLDEDDDDGHATTAERARSVRATVADAEALTALERDTNLVALGHVFAGSALPPRRRAGALAATRGRPGGAGRGRGTGRPAGRLPRLGSERGCDTSASAPMRGGGDSPGRRWSGRSAYAGCGCCGRTRGRAASTSTSGGLPTGREQEAEWPPYPVELEYTR